MSSVIVSSLARTAQLLLEDGDERIELDALHGVNRYGCTATPNDALLSFASSTASVISTGGFAAAQQLRDALETALQHQSAATLYAQQLANMRTELAALCGVSTAHPADIIFAASGTDLHHIAAQLSLAASTQPLLVLMVDSSETGSGVVTAISHPNIEVANVALRLANGSPRSMAAIDNEFSLLAEQAYSAGRQVLLIVTDQSKTGLIAPSYARTAALHQNYGARLDVLIDACQFRIAPATLQACLDKGYSVAITGSKFVGGPSFSGALIIPEALAATQRARPFPDALRCNSSAAEWPDSWQLSNTLASTEKFGMLLRWQAALHELRAFRAIPDHKIRDFMQRFARAIQTRLNNDAAFSSVAVGALDRSALHQNPSWDDIPTLFPFELYRVTANSRSLLERAAVHSIYRHLPHASQPCQLGQAVNFALDKCALRLCLSARLVVQALSSGEEENIITQAHAVLDQVAALAQHSPTKFTHVLATSFHTSTSYPSAHFQSLHH
ncbi:MAG: hypothetical protein RL358_1319 [Pseudomonadota bacterium]